MKTDHFRGGYIYFILWAVFGLFPCLHAQTGAKIKFTATAPEEVVAGNSLEIAFKLTGSTGGRINMPDFSPFRHMGSTREMSGMQFENGDVQAHHIWVISLLAPSAGDYTIPSATVVVNGKTYTAAPVKIRVVAANKGNNGGNISKRPASGDPNVFITTEFNKNTVYEGEQVICTINIYTKFNLSGIDLVSIPKAGTAAMQDLERFNAQVSEAVVDGVTYTKRAIYAAAFFPEKAGKLTVEPVQANVAIEPANILLPTQPVRLSTQPAVLEVKPLPTPAPAGFTGVVGAYHVEAQTDHDTAAVGEAFVFEFSIRGNGNARYFSPPPLKLPDGLEVFDPVIKEDESFENGQELIHRQILEYAISAKKTGEYSCAPTLVWFDPDSSKYVSFSPKFTLKVVESNGETADNVNVSPRNNTRESFWSSPKFIGGVALAAAALLLALYFLITKKRQNEPQNIAAKDKAIEPDYFSVTSPDPAPEVTPAPVPLAVAPSHKDGSSISYMPDNQLFYRTVYSDLQRHFVQRMGAKSEALSADQISTWMRANGYDEQRVADIRWILQTCEEALYAGQNHSAEMPLIETLMQGMRNA